MSKAKWIFPLLLSAAATFALYARPRETPRPAPRFTGLGDLPGGTTISVANGISADGKVVVGYSHSGISMEAFRWTEADGLEGLGFPYAFAASRDGSAVAGYRYIDDRIEPVRWTTEHHIEGLDPAGHYRDGAAYGISADGETLVGVVGRGKMVRDSAFWWHRGEGLTPLAGVDGPEVRDEAHAVSADGRVVVGAWRNETGRNQAFRWTAEGGIVELGFLNGHTASVAYGVSADGSVIVGASGDYGATEAFRWTAETGMVRLEPLDADRCDDSSYGHAAYSVSADGAVVVGRSTSKTGWNAVVWDARGRVRSVRELLVSSFQDRGRHDDSKNGDMHDRQRLRGWKLQTATAVSADGSVVVGSGVNPHGEREAWIARLGILAEGGGSKVARLGDQASCSVPARKKG
ncbi:MAG: hypothetical protein AB7G28_03010 [Pirellulales bacterium]